MKSVLTICAAILFAGCGVTDPNTQLTAPQPAITQTEPSTTALPKFVGTGGKRSPKLAIDSYAAAIATLPDQPDSTTTRRLLSLVSRAQARRTLRLVDRAIQQAGDDSEIERSELVSSSVENTPSGPIGYAIMREGSYTPAGGLIGSSHLKVYAVTFAETRRGFIIDRWIRAE